MSAPSTNPVINRCRILIELVQLPSGDGTRRAVEAAYRRDDTAAAVEAMQAGLAKFGALGYLVDDVIKASGVTVSLASEEIGRAA